MSGINVGRVIVGGLLAGLVVNVSEFVLNTFVVAKDMEAAMKAMNLPAMDPSQIPYFVVFSFALGIVTVWLYAAIRSRFGPGVPTAAYAALTVWFLAYLYPTLFFLVLHIFPVKALIISAGWGLVEILVAGIAGAWAYTEA